MTEAQKDEYIQDREREDGIHMDKSQIPDKQNKGLYEIMKLPLVALWGKFGQRNEYGEQFILSGKSPQQAKEARIQWNNIQNNYNIDDWEILSEDTVLIKAMKNLTIQEKDKNKVLHKKSKLLDVDRAFDKNIAYAIFTTAQARLKLFNEFLNPLQGRVLYYDTDSVIFWTYGNEDPKDMIPCALRLGAPNNEIKNMNGEKTPGFYNDNWITEFHCGGCKNYLVYYRNGKSLFKCKGLPLRKPSQETNEKLNIQIAKQSLLSGIPVEGVPSGQVIIRKHSKYEDQSYYQLVSPEDPHVKVYRSTLRKEQILPAEMIGADGFPLIQQSAPWTTETFKEFLEIMGVLEKAQPTVEPDLEILEGLEEEMAILFPSSADALD